MTIKSDRWIRRMAAQGMIEPFEPGQVREVNGRRIVSYGTSSCSILRSAMRRGSSTRQ